MACTLQQYTKNTRQKPQGGPRDDLSLKHIQFPLKFICRIAFNVINEKTNLNCVPVVSRGTHDKCKTQYYELFTIHLYWAMKLLCFVVFVNI